MRSEGNCGNGDVGAITEPREAQPHVERVEEVAWHRGATASATGRDAMKRRRMKAEGMFRAPGPLSENDQERIAALLRGPSPVDLPVPLGNPRSGE